jgi:hypothetical protein
MVDQEKTDHLDPAHSSKKQRTGEASTEPPITGAGPSQGRDKTQDAKQKLVYNKRMGVKGMQNNNSDPMEITVEDHTMQNEWHQVPHANRRQYSAIVRMSLLHGETHKNKVGDLQDLFMQHEVHCVEGPYKTKTVDGDAALKVTVETREDLDKLLAFTTFEDGDEEQETPLFTTVDNSKRENITERTIEVYGLHPRTSEVRIRMAMNKLGKIEEGHIVTRPCTKGFKITAMVVFTNVETVKKIKDSGRTSVFVGTQLARLRKIGTEMVDWHMEHVAKLSGLPRYTTEMDLASLLGEGKADFIDIPYVFQGERRFTNLSEAFVYFKSPEDMATLMATPVRIGDREMFWGDKHEKRCRQCHQLGHIMKDCQVYQEVLETRAHMKAVRAYQRGGTMRVSPQRSFANIVGNASVHQQQQQPQQQTQHVQQQQQPQQAQHAANRHETTTGSNEHGQNPNKFSNEYDKKFNQMNATINRLLEEQERITSMNKVLMHLVIQMISSNMGQSVSPDLLEAAGLGSDICRVATGPTPKKGKGKAKDMLSINESLAGINAKITEHKSGPGGSQHSTGRTHTEETQHTTHL